MKKRIVLFILCCFLLGSIPVQAEKAGETPLEWEISVRPKPTAQELEQERWSHVFTNDIGAYVYDNKSLRLDAEDKHIVHVLTKTIFIDAKAINGLNKKYKEKLQAGKKVSYIEMQIAVNIKEKTYAMTETKVYSGQGTLLEDCKQPVNFISAPVKTFAGSIYAIAKSFAQEMVPPE